MALFEEDSILKHPVVSALISLVYSAFGFYGAWLFVNPVGMIGYIFAAIYSSVIAGLIFLSMFCFYSFEFAFEKESSEEKVVREKAEVEMIPEEGEGEVRFEGRIDIK